MIVVNGEPAPDALPGETVAELLERAGLATSARGLAVAVDGEVVPRSSWRSHALSDGARVEIVSAMQGG